MTSDDLNSNEAPVPPSGENPGSPADQAPGGKPAEAKPVPPAKPLLPVKPAKPVKRQGGGVVPKKASEDDPRTWGDSESGNDHDAWLKEQRPPHWG